MTDTQATQQILERKLAELLERASGIEDVLSDRGDSDWEENAVEMEADEAMAAVGDVTKKEIQEIRLALSRLSSGTYGVCVTCGKPIAPERLSELPSTSTCSRCA
ncbi:MAG: TraR/DksA family transcriptional regulator [Planctomycetaceae bacterium]|nr:TraR/DksA family transcriptional regulator [Planctomycetaceae bacterium]